MSYAVFMLMKSGLVKSSSYKMSKSEVNNIPFDPESGNSIQRWMTHFDKTCIFDKKR